jgi:tetratricopeptide (TPR) repeat protein
MPMRSPRLLFLFGFLGAAVVVPAFAQQQQPATTSYPPACEESKMTRADRERAHTVYLSGKQYFEESNYDKAISYFTDAYAIDCSVHGILLAIATAYERKGDRREAVAALEEYQRRAPNASDHEVVERRIKNLRDQIAREQPPPSPASTTTSSVAPPGSAAEAPLAVGANAAAPTPNAPLGYTAGPWILTAVGAAAVVGGSILLSVGVADVSTASSACPTRLHCQQSVTDQGNTGRTLEPVGFAVGGVGLAVVAAGLVWHFTEAPSATTSGLRVDPIVAPGYSGMALRGSF